jgi:hypothetical protein
VITAKGSFGTPKSNADKYNFRKRDAAAQPIYFVCKKSVQWSINRMTPTNKQLRNLTRCRWVLPVNNGCQLKVIDRFPHKVRISPTTYQLLIGPFRATKFLVVAEHPLIHSVKCRHVRRRRIQYHVSRLNRFWTPSVVHGASYHEKGCYSSLRKAILKDNANNEHAIFNFLTSAVFPCGRTGYHYFFFRLL